MSEEVLVYSIFVIWSIGSNPCEHAGKCLNTNGSFQCKCPQGYVGARCELDVNECMSSPCQNDATCLDQIGGFHCICMAGKEAYSHCIYGTVNSEAHVVVQDTVWFSFAWFFSRVYLLFGPLERETNLITSLSHLTSLAKIEACLSVLIDRIRGSLLPDQYRRVC